MYKKFGLLGIGVIIGLALLLGGWRLVSGPYRYQGSLIDPPVPAGEIQLTNQDGQPFSLSQQRGKVVMVFFGFTNCTDVCPVTMAQFKQVKDALGTQAQDVVFVFITVDPHRDTQPILKAFVNRFDPSFIGLTGTDQQLEQVYTSYGVYHEISHDQHGANYDVQHSSITYMIDKYSNWRLTYPYGTETASLVSDVEHLVAEK